MEIIILPKESALPPLEVLQRRFPAAPRSYLRGLLHRGKVRRGHAPLMPHDPLTPGDILHLPESRRLRELQRVSAAEEVTILFESREILAVEKPSGLAVHRGVGHEEDNLVRRVERLMARRGEPFRCAPAHRLDAGTSGAVLMGKGRRATAELGKAFMAGEVAKTYLALAAGPLDGEGALRGAIPAKGKMKEAQTLYRALSRTGELTLLQVNLISGRTHQIRRHLADNGHPLAGDRRYGGPALPGLERLFLHCRRLALKSPFDGSEVLIDSPLPPELGAVLQAVGLPFPEGLS